MTDLTPPKAVIFDWDNTLVNSWPVIQDALNATFRAYGLPEWSMAETREKVRHSMRDSFPQLFGDEWEKAGEVFYARYAEIHPEQIRPADGAETLLRTLSGQGTYLAVVSNKNGDYLRDEAKRLGWASYFGRLVGAFDAPRDKPDPAPVEMALAPDGLEMGPDIWFVGDADIDLTCAHHAGCVPILVRPEAPGREEFTEHPPKRHFTDCMQLCKFILSM